jgi:hypothetical protein
MMDAMIAWHRFGGDERTREPPVAAQDEDRALDAFN